MMAAPLPLLNWQAMVELDRIQAKREQLLKRIQSYRPHAHKRIELEADLKKLTLEHMALSNRLREARQ